MATFLVNKGWGNSTEVKVEAEDYSFDGLFLTFHDEDQINVYSVPTNTVGSVEREGALVS